jgi:heterodisulfide reductase subunit B
MPSNREETLCCGALTHITYPDLAQGLARKFMDEVNKAGADMLINFCSFCGIALGPIQKEYPFSMTEASTLINMAMGGKRYEDKLQKYRACKDIDEILALSRPYFEAHGLKEKDIRDFISVIFGS